MTLAAWLLAAGLLQVLICAVLVFSARWSIPIALFFLVLPFVPLILMQEIRGWRRLDPIIPAITALLSIAASAGFYWELFRRMAE
jgi:hypothetical protein